MTIAWENNAASGGARWVCVARADNPHWSSKERGGTVLFKTRVTCTGPSEPDVRVVGTLSSSSTEGGPYKNRASSDTTQRVPINGIARTYYTPGQGAPKVWGSGYYRATITATVVSPVPSTISSQTSDEVWVGTP